MFGECAPIDADSYFRLRSTVATAYALHPNDVLVVGSGKLGFSIAPKKRYKSFGDTSDLDVVIVSERFFDLIWEDLHRYENGGGYWERADTFKRYLFQGWIRPDMLPPDGRFGFAKHWWQFFNGLSASRAYPVPRIRGAIYKNWHFLEAYQTQAISLCATAVMAEVQAKDEN